MSNTALTMTIEMDPVGSFYRADGIPEAELRRRIEELTGKVHRVLLTLFPLERRHEFVDVPLPITDGSVLDADLRGVLNGVLARFPISSALAIQLNEQIDSEGLTGFEFPTGSNSVLEVRAVEAGFRSDRNYCETSEGIVCYGHSRLFLGEVPVLWRQQEVMDGRMEIFVTGRFALPKLQGSSSKLASPRRARRAEA